MKKYLLALFLLSLLLILASCNEGMIYSDLKITDTNGAGTKIIKAKILHDDCLKEQMLL